MRGDADDLALRLAGRPTELRVVTERACTYRMPINETRIAQATLGNEAGLYGAAYLPWIES